MTTGLPTRNAAPVRDENGYSLVEVLVAASLLLGVLLAIMGMFVYGGRSVNAGKLMTKASAIAGDVLEEFHDRSPSQCWLLIEDSAGVGSVSKVTWNSTTNAPNDPDNATSQAKLDE